MAHPGQPPSTRNTDLSTAKHVIKPPLLKGLDEDKRWVLEIFGKGAQRADDGQPDGGRATAERPRATETPTVVEVLAPTEAASPLRSGSRAGSVRSQVSVDSAASWTSRASRTSRASQTSQASKATQVSFEDDAVDAFDQVLEDISQRLRHTEKDLSPFGIARLFGMGRFRRELRAEAQRVLWQFHSNVMGRLGMSDMERRRKHGGYTREYRRCRAKCYRELLGVRDDVFWYLDSLKEKGISEEVHVREMEETFENHDRALRSMADRLLMASMS